MRILRAIRFISTLDFTISAETYDAIYTTSPLLKNISSERISAELDKILCGNSWIRAISLCLETKLFENIFNISNVDNYKDDFMEILNNYNIDTISPDRRNRWVAIIMAIIGASLIQSPHLSYIKILNNSLNRIRHTLKWSNEFSDDIYQRAVDDAQKDTLKELEKQYQQLVKSDDGKQFIVEEKMLKIKMKQAFSNFSFKKAANIARDLIIIQNKGFEIKVRLGANEGQLAKDVLPYFLNTIKYICAYEIEKYGSIKSEKDIKNINNTILKRKDNFDLIIFSVGKRDRLTAIEESLLMISRMLKSKITSLTDVEIIELNSAITRDCNRLAQIKSGYIKQLIDIRKPPYADNVNQVRSELNLKVSEIYLEMHKGAKSYEYYSFLIDYYKWGSLASNTLNSFWENFSAMNDTMDETESLENCQTYDVISHYIDNSKCLVHGLSLTDDHGEKISIVRNIVANYKLIGGTGSNKNIARYQLLLEWFIISDQIIKSEFVNSLSILYSMPNLKSYHYKDADEEYISENMKDVDVIRKNMYDVESFLSCINSTKNDFNIHDSSIKSVSRLFTNSYIDNVLAFEIFKNILRSKVSKNSIFEPIQIQNETIIDNKDFINENIKLIKNGEDKNVELKQSWRYDVKQKQIDPTGAVLESSLKAIASFMNTKGGKLFVGVHDKTEITGLEAADFSLFKRKNLSPLELQDKLKRLMDENIIKAIGKPAASLVDISFDSFEDKTFSILDIKPSNKAIFLNKKFYTRFNGSCQEYNVEEMYNFMNNKQQDADIEIS